MLFLGREKLVNKILLTITIINLRIQLRLYHFFWRDNTATLLSQKEEHVNDYGTIT